MEKVEALIAELNEGSVLEKVADVGELDLIDATLLSFVDGETALGSIARQLALPLDEASAIASRLIERGAIALIGGATKTPRANERQKAEQKPNQEADEDENTELDPLRRALVDSTYAQLESASLYELLEVSPDAELREIRDAYFRLSKLFHPDTLYGKRLGSYREKMEAIFREMTSAYEILGRKRRRAEYDERLGEARLNMLRARMLGDVDAPPQRSQGGARRQLDAEARRRLARQRLSGGLRSGLRAPSAAPRREASERASTGEGQNARAAADALFRSLEARSGGPDPVDALAKRAHRAEEEGRFEEALNQWLALERVQPEFPGLARKLDELRAVIARANLPEYRALAAAHLRAGRTREAALVYGRICTGAPDDIDAHLTAASIFRKLEPPDLRSARDYALRAQALDPSRLSIRLLLIRIYLDAGMRHNATRYLDELLADHPDDPEAQALRRELVGS